MNKIAMNKIAIVASVMLAFSVFVVLPTSIKMVSDSKPVEDKYLIGDWSIVLDSEGCPMHIDSTPHIEGLHNYE